MATHSPPIAARVTGFRPYYHQGYYGAFVIDLDGCKLKAVHHP